MTLRPFLIAALALLAACAEPAPLPSLAPIAAKTIEPGEMVEVQPGDTVYAVARRYKVPMRDVIALNNLKAPFTLQPGARLTLPAKEIMVARGPTRQEYMKEPHASGDAPLSILTPANDGDVPQQDRVEGETLYRQEATAKQMVYSGAEKEVVLYAPANQNAMDLLAQDSSKQPVIIEGAAEKPKPVLKNDTGLKPPVFPKGNAGRFIWPVQGPINASFGNKGGGMRNDGINISAPFGTPVAAADAGTVAYAGSEIPGYGNVVLIRHADGYMTTYAHLERILVQTNSVAAKGDVIGTVGTSGGVATAQLHFEIRKGAQAVDPSKYLSK